MDRLTPGIIALGLGGLLAILLIVPYLAVVYRRRGQLGFGFVLLSFGTLVYALALVCYTTLPLPSDPSTLCADPARPQLVPGASLLDIQREGLDSPGDLLRNAAFLQVALNVLFFVPLGMLLRHLFRRGVLTTVLLGFAVSLFIELTQLTGIWFLYPCAYRLFDVDDLIANTTGALLGALLAPVLRIIPGQKTQGDADAPRPVTAGRRLLGVLVDVLAFSLVSSALILVVRLGVAALRGLDALEATWLLEVPFWANLVVLFASLVIVLASSRTLGEVVVRLEPHPRPGLLRLLVRWLAGIGGYQLLLAFEFPFSALVLAALVVTSFILVFTTRGHRGFAGVVSGIEIRDSREGRR